MPDKITDPSRIGDIAEKYVVTWLWDNNYEVFCNAGTTGYIDLIAVDPMGKPVYIDVKSKNSDKHYGFSRSEIQKHLGVRVVEFNGKTRKCRWIDHRELHNENS